MFRATLTSPFYLLVTFILLCTVSCTGDEAASSAESVSVVQVKEAGQPASPDFEDAFNLEETIVLRGDESAPLFSSGFIALTEDRIIVPDPMNHTVHVFSRSGQREFVIGREGKGPGEFKEPNWVGVDDEGRIYVREDLENFRVQRFQADGALIDAFPLYSFGPFDRSFLLEEDGEQHVFTATRTFCGQENAGDLCVVQKQNLEGDVLAKFGEELEIEPGRKGLPYVAGFYGADRVYLAHRNGGNVASYTLDGTRLNSFDLGVSSSAQLLDMEALPDNPMERRAATKGVPFTILRKINFYKDYIVLDHLRINYPEGTPRHVLDLFDLDGNLIYEEIETPYFLETVDLDRFYFITESEEAEFGEIRLHAYSFSGN